MWNSGVNVGGPIGSVMQGGKVVQNGISGSFAGTVQTGIPQQKIVPSVGQPLVQHQSPSITSVHSTIPTVTNIVNQPTPIKLQQNIPPVGALPLPRNIPTTTSIDAPRIPPLIPPPLPTQVFTPSNNKTPQIVPILKKIDPSPPVVPIVAPKVTAVTTSNPITIQNKIVPTVTTPGVVTNAVVRPLGGQTLGSTPIVTTGLGVPVKQLR